MTETLPRVSTADSRRTSTLRLTIRCAPSASDIVTYRRKRFRDDRDRQGDSEDQHLPERLPPEDAKTDDEGDDGHGAAREEVAHAVEVRLQRRSPALDTLQEPGDRSELRPHAGLDDDRRSAPVRHGRAAVHDVPPVAEREIGTGQRLAHLGDRQRLSGQGRFVELEVHGLGDPCVSGDSRAGGEANDVAGHQVTGGDLALVAVAQGDRHRGRHAPQRLDRTLGAVLLGEAEQDGEQQDHADDNRLEDVSQHRGEGDGEEQDQDEDVLELREEQAPRRNTGRGDELVRAVLTQAARRLFAAQSAARGAEPVEGVRDGKGVPRHAALRLLGGPLAQIAVRP